MVSVVGTVVVMVIVVGTGSAVARTGVVMVIVVGTGVVMVSVVVSGLGLVEVSGFVDRCRLYLVMLLVKVI